MTSVVYFTICWRTRRSVISSISIAHSQRPGTVPTSTNVYVSNPEEMKRSTQKTEELVKYLIEIEPSDISLVDERRSLYLHVRQGYRCRMARYNDYLVCQ
jgi:hypothetical protein